MFPRNCLKELKIILGFFVSYIFAVWFSSTIHCMGSSMIVGEFGIEGERQLKFTVRYLLVQGVGSKSILDFRYFML